jgi:hypothetical protein
MKYVDLRIRHLAPVILVNFCLPLHWPCHVITYGGKSNKKNYREVIKKYYMPGINQIKNIIGIILKNILQGVKQNSHILQG